MYRVLGALGIVTSVALALLSMIINWQFGRSLGDTWLAGILLASVAVAFDTFKSLMPFFGERCYHHRQYGLALIALIIWCGCSVISFTSAVGFSVANRTASEQAHQLQNVQLQSLLGELKRLEASANAAGISSPVSVAREQVKLLEQDRLWAQTANCTNATLAKSIAFCHGYRQTKVAQQMAKSQERRAHRIQDIHRQIAKLKDTTSSASANIQITFLSGLLGLAPDVVKTSIVVIVALLLELATGFGCLLSSIYLSSYLNPAHAHPMTAPPHPQAPFNLQPPVLEDTAEICQPDPIAQFLQDVIQPDEGHRVDGSALYAHYRRWCQITGLEPRSQARFGKLIKDVGMLHKATVGGRVRYLDVSLKPLGNQE